VMGLIFDIESARRYESWYRSARGRAMDRFVEKAIYELLDPRPKERVLDIGCGSGNHLLFFNKLGIDIYCQETPWSSVYTEEGYGGGPAIR